MILFSLFLTWCNIQDIQTEYKELNDIKEKYIEINEEIVSVKHETDIIEKEILFKENYEIPYLESNIVELFIAHKNNALLSWEFIIRFEYENPESTDVNTISPIEYEILIRYEDIIYNKNLEKVKDKEINSKTYLVNLENTSKGGNQIALFVKFSYDNLNAVINKIISEIWIEKIDNIYYSPGGTKFEVVLNDGIKLYFDEDSIDTWLNNYIKIKEHYGDYWKVEYIHTIQSWDNFVKFR